MSSKAIFSSIAGKAKRSQLRWAVLTLIGLVFGVASSQMYKSVTAPAAYMRNKTVVLPNTFAPGYLAIYIERTRTTWCDIKPARILFSYTTMDVGGKQIPVVFPVYTQNFIWPALGDQKFILLVPAPAKLPGSQWYMQSVFSSSCHWYNFFTGPQLAITQPIRIELP